MPPKKQIPPQRQLRADGDATRAHILETAGELFAERGYDRTTSKAICEQAKVNMAAINYHFGSRDGLYLEILRDVHRHAVDIGFLQELVNAKIPAADKLRLYFEKLVTRRLEGFKSWELRLWTREILSPSPLLGNIMLEESHPKFDALAHIIAEIAGISPTHSSMPRLVLSTVAPCLVMLTVDKRTHTPFYPLLDMAPAWGRLRERAKSYAKALANDILR